MKKLIKFNLIFIILLHISCIKEESEKGNTVNPPTTSSFGVGPIQTKLELGPIDDTLAKKGEALFNEKCTACHKIDERYVGPPIKDVTKRRTPEWIMNMIIEPVKMTQEDPIAKELLAEYLTQMTNQNINKEDARAILEYFRKLDSN